MGFGFPEIVICSARNDNKKGRNDTHSVTLSVSAREGSRNESQKRPELQRELSLRGPKQACPCFRRGSNLMGLAICSARNDAPFVTLTLNPSPPVILTLTLNEVKRKGKDLILLRTGSVKAKGLAVTIKKGMHRHAVVLSYKVSTSHLNEIMVAFPI